MEQLSEEQQNAIGNALSAKGVGQRCPRCNRDELRGIERRYGQVPGSISNPATALDYLACAFIVCGNCGFVSLHSLGILGLE